MLDAGRRRRPALKFFATDDWCRFATAWLLLPASLLGGGLGALLARGSRPVPRTTRIVALGAILLGAGPLAWATPHGWLRRAMRARP